MSSLESERHVRRRSPKARRSILPAVLAGASLVAAIAGRAEENVHLTEVPDYAWHVGCFGTATGNLFGYWDRHGFPNYYTGPTQDGLAPLDSFGSNRGIRSLWSSRAGLDGRPDSVPGHFDDYYIDYEVTAPDPYLTAGRPEHSPDCSGDFVGLSQRKWASLAGECAGNIDGYAFNYFDPDGDRRVNYLPPGDGQFPVRDVQSGIRAFSRHRGYDSDSFSQLSDFNPDKPAGRGFTFADLKAELDAGYPVLLFMQAFGDFSRELEGVPGLNPNIHAMLAYGYYVTDGGDAFVRYRTSWASGDLEFSRWDAGNWTPDEALNLPLRGVIGFRPHPRIVGINRVSGGLHLSWHGPRSVLRDEVADVEYPVHRYVVEQTDRLEASAWTRATEPTTDLSATVPICCAEARFFRVRLLEASD
ncbi:MAG: hypothetical protein AB7O66_12315 [Limisphaerales bacterium]